jgi:hypothetical protein
MVDRAANIRAAENAEMRALFAEAVGMVEDARLRARLRKASETRNGSLRMNSLNETNHRLKALLIGLQAHAEGSRASWAPPLEKRNWAHLVEAVGRRKLPLPALGWLLTVGGPGWNFKQAQRSLRAMTTVKWTLALTVFLVAAAVFGCGVEQTAPETRPAVQVPARPLPFKGRLVNGDPDQLPPAVAMSLSGSSAVEFSYREDLTHDEHHVSLLYSALNPATYAGAALGEYGVNAFASLAILKGNMILGDYTAKVRVSEPYSIYAEPTHMELERRARAEVRDAIDQKLYRDEDRLADLIAGRGKSPVAPTAK